jgi:hypothetical protein
MLLPFDPYAGHMSMTNPSKRYFSARHGRGPKSEPLTVDTLKRLVFNVWDHLFECHYFQEAFGYECVDAGTVHGTVGSDPSAYFLRVLGRDGMWPYRAGSAMGVGQLGRRRDVRHG